MFPYLKRISDFLKDCETIEAEPVRRKTGVYELETLYHSHPWEKREGCDGNCSKCKEMPAVVTNLIRNVDAANWGCDPEDGIGTVAFSEIRAWCHSLCGALYDVLKPLEHSDLMVGLEYYLETRKGFGPEKKNHFRVDVMIGGYGLKYGSPEARLLVIEQKQYDRVTWKKGGRELTWALGSVKATTESPCRQVTFYCDNIHTSQKENADSSIALYPCVYMHNLRMDLACADAYEELDKTQADGLLVDNGTRFQDKPVDIFIHGGDETDPYRTFRNHIRELFNYNGDADVDPLNIFKDLKKIYPRLSPEELGNILVCSDEDLEERFRSLLRPDQFFAMYGYDNNRNWDNYIKNHIDFVSFLRLPKDREFWGPLKYGIIDLIEGGPGSGKTVLAMLILRYCLLRGLKVLYVFAGSGPVNRIFEPMLGSKSLASHLDKGSFKIVGIQDLAKNTDFDVYLIDDAHIDKETTVKKGDAKSNARIIWNLKEAKKLIFLFYDRHQIIREPGSDDTKEKEYHDLLDQLSKEGENRREFRDVNAFRLWSRFRCNRDEGYLTYIETMLGIRSYDPRKELDLFDFDVHFVDASGVKGLVTGNMGDNKLLILSELEDETKLSEILGRDACIYKGKNGTLPSLPAKGKVYVGNALKVRGLEADRVLVILDDRIKFPDGKLIENMDLRKRYRILLTRGLKECHIYVMNKKLREHMINASSNER